MTPTLTLYTLIWTTYFQKPQSNNFWTGTAWVLPFLFWDNWWGALKGLNFVIDIICLLEFVQPTFWNHNSMISNDIFWLFLTTWRLWNFMVVVSCWCLHLLWITEEQFLDGSWDSEAVKYGWGRCKPSASRVYISCRLYWWLIWITLDCRRFSKQLVRWTARIFSSNWRLTPLSLLIIHRRNISLHPPRLLCKKMLFLFSPPTCCSDRPKQALHHLANIIWY